MAKSKQPTVEEIIEAMPNLSDEHFMKLRERVAVEYEARLRKAEQVLNTLNNNNK